MRKEPKIGARIIIATLIFLSMSICSQALSIVSNSNYSASENSTLNFTINLTEANGTTALTTAPEIGQLTKISESQYAFSWATGFSDAGNHEIIFSAADASSSASKIVTITITNTNNPIYIVSRTPDSTVYQDTPLISVTTNREATCKYSLSDKKYEDMEYVMSAVADKKTHTGITPKLNEGQSTIYVGCSDQYQSATMQNEKITLDVNLRPTASIKISKDPPLKIGTYTIELTTSESLIAVPELRYSYDDDANWRTISLVGSGNTYTGYLIIKDIDAERIGTFSYKGIDLTNTDGLIITSGQIFLVDTKKPSVVQSIDVENREDDVRLEWKYQGTDADSIKEYKVYKKEGSGGTDFTDYLTTSKKDTFIDDDVDPEQAYYYRVSAVDEAGNEGDLSKEVFVTYIPTKPSKQDTKEIETATKQEKLDPKLMLKLKGKLKQIDKILIDIDEVEGRMSKTLGAERVEAMQSLGILSRIRESKRMLIERKGSLQALENISMSEQELDAQTENILFESNNIWQGTPTNLEVMDTATYQEFNDDQKTEDIITDYYTIKDTNLGQLKQIVPDTKKLQDKLTIEVQVIRSNITYPSRTEAALTVKKTIQSSEPLSDSFILESIPKTVAATASSVLFNEKPEIIKDDPLVKWDAASLVKKQVIYSIITPADIIDIKASKAIVSQNLNPDPSDNQITGMASEESPESPGNQLFLPIVFGVIIIIALAGYYFLSGEQQDENKGRLSNTLGRIATEAHARRLNIFRRSKQDDSQKKLALPEDKILNGHKVLFREVVDEPLQEGGESNLHRDKLSTLKEAHQHLKNYMEEQELNEDIDIEHLNKLREATGQIRQLCSDIEQRHETKFTRRTQKQLEDALKYISRTLDKKEETPIKIENKRQAKAVPLKKQKKERKLDDINKIKRRIIKAINEVKTGNNQTTNNEDYISITAPEIHAKYHSTPCQQGKEFILHSGVSLKSISELKDALLSMDDSLFSYHVNSERNDFSNWINDVFQDHELAEIVKKYRNKNEIIDVLK